jgi:hypothetical protein
MRDRPPLALVREAFEAAREKHYLIARTLYPAVFGAEWRSAILTFSYLKCLDDLVDEDPDPQRALATLDRQRVAIERGYSGGLPATSAGPERFGMPVFARDRHRGGSLRDPVEAILDSMEFDTRRRGEQLDAAALDAYVLDLGSRVFDLFSRLTASCSALAEDLVAEGSRAYLYADALIDLQHDLALGVINVSREDVSRHALCCRPGDARLQAWIAERAPAVFAHFARALAQLRTLPGWRLRYFLVLFLANKQRKLRRYVAALSAAEGRQAAAASGGSGSV